MGQRGAAGHRVQAGQQGHHPAGAARHRPGATAPTLKSRRGPSSPSSQPQAWPPEQRPRVPRPDEAVGQGIRRHRHQTRAQDAPKGSRAAGQQGPAGRARVSRASGPSGAVRRASQQPARLEARRGDPAWLIPTMLPAARLGDSGVGECSAEHGDRGMCRSACSADRLSTQQPLYLTVSDSAKTLDAGGSITRSGTEVQAEHHQLANLGGSLVASLGSCLARLASLLRM